jgi:predicted PurR-regulated permease PerM
VLIGVVIHQFTVLETPWAVLFLVWCVLVGISDNILKPVLLGRGVDLPMLVIFMGAIGGVLTSGILGLFVGPVVLALGYTLFMLWVAEAKAQVARAEATRPA